MQQFRPSLTVMLALSLSLCAPAVEALPSGCVGSPGGNMQRLDRRVATRLLLIEPRPSYPPIARINYIHGSVSLVLTVDCSGRVESAHVVRGHPFLAAASLRAIKKWIYRPFETRSGPAPFETEVDVNFDLMSSNFKQLPPKPERFVARAVRPPQLPPGVASTAAPSAVRMRVLVNAQGRMVDSTLLSGSPADYEAAQRVVARWHFRPARWGTLRVPWYVNVAVPLGAVQNAPALVSPGGAAPSAVGAPQSAAPRPEPRSGRSGPSTPGRVRSGGEG